MKVNQKIVIENVVFRLKDMLQWSQRIGSDEIYEIQDIIKYLKEKK